MLPWTTPWNRGRCSATCLPRIWGRKVDNDIKTHSPSERATILEILRGSIRMKTVILAGTALVLLAVNPARADIPKKADVPRYIKQLQSSPSAKTRAAAAEALGHRGAIRKADVTAAIDPLITALKKDK